MKVYRSKSKSEAYYKVKGIVKPAYHYSARKSQNYIQIIFIYFLWVIRKTFNNISYLAM